MPRVSRHKARYRAFRMGASKPMRKGMPFRKIIAAAYVKPNNEYALHATKGFRYRRLSKNKNALLEALMERIQ